MAAASAEEIAEIVQEAIAREESLEVIGAGTKRGIGRPVNATRVLDVSACTGIVSYQPSELVLTARAGTPLAEIEALLAASNQMLAFEPPDYAPVFGRAPGRATLGGIIAANASGSRRLKTGAARDHVLGVTAISGRGEIFKAGGQVVKNVTGYDLPRLLAGSFGTLAVMSEITLKVLPRPETEKTLMIRKLDAGIAVSALAAALQSAWDVSGAAYLPDEATAVLRIEGIAASVDDRFAQLHKLLATFGGADALDAQASRALWASISNVSSFAPGGEIIWRLSLPPVQSAAAGSKLCETIPGARALYDWGGGLVWLALPGTDALAEIVRAVAARAGGHALLFRAPDEVRSNVPVMPPLEPALMALTLRVKEQFDPKRVLNPGRAYAEL